MDDSFEKSLFSLYNYNRPIQFHFELWVFFLAEGGHANDEQSAYKTKPVHVITCK